jgi:hypothetical protein
MLRWQLYIFIALLAFGALGSIGAAAPASPTPKASGSAATPKASGSAAALATPAAATLPSLTQEEMTSASTDQALSVPTPGELMAALNKQGKPNWQSQYRQPIPTVYTSRPQIALNLGGLIADGYIAIEAEDSQQVKNIGKDIIALAKTLNVSENVLRRGKSIEEFADNNEWNTLKEELEATQDEVKITMEEQQDRDLVVMVTLGGWIRGTEVITGWISENYTADAAKLLRQPAVVAILRTGLDKLPEKLKDDPLIKEVSKRLSELETMVSFPRDSAPTLADVKKMKAATSAMVALITSKK